MAIQRPTCGTFRPTSQKSASKFRRLNGPIKDFYDDSPNINSQQKRKWERMVDDTRIPFLIPPSRILTPYGATWKNSAWSSNWTVFATPPKLPLSSSLKPPQCLQTNGNNNSCWKINSCNSRGDLWCKFPVTLCFFSNFDAPLQRRSGMILTGSVMCVA